MIDQRLHSPVRFSASLTDLQGRQRQQKRSVRARGAVPTGKVSQVRESLPLNVRVARLMPWLLASVLMGVMILAAIWMPRWLAQYPINEVRVEGEVRDERRLLEVETALRSLLEDQTFFSVSLKAIYQELTTLDWVESVKVRRHWPDRLLLVIHERVPVAVWNSEVLVSGEGSTFGSPSRYAIESLTQLSGPPDRLAEVMGYYHSMGRMLQPLGVSIKALSVDERLTARLTLDNGLKLVVDREHYAAKLHRYVRSHHQLWQQQGRQPVRVDLRYSDGMAITWEVIEDKPREHTS